MNLRIFVLLPVLCVFATLDRDDREIYSLPEFLQQRSTRYIPCSDYDNCDEINNASVSNDLYNDLMDYNEGSFTGIQNKRLEHTKRPLKCHREENNNTDVGYGYYPRFLHAVYCVSLNIHGCTEVCSQALFSVKVLTKKNVGVEYKERNLLPQALRDHWCFEKKDIPSGCFCTH